MGFEQISCTLFTIRQPVYINESVGYFAYVYYRFCVQGLHFQFQSLPVGLAVAPRIFTKVMAAIGGLLRRQRVCIFLYLYDWLIKNKSRVLLQKQLLKTVNLLIELGLLINQSRHISAESNPIFCIPGGEVRYTGRFSIPINCISYVFGDHTEMACFASFWYSEHFQIIWSGFTVRTFIRSSACFSNPFSGSVDRRISMGLGVMQNRHTCQDSGQTSSNFIISISQKCKRCGIL